MKKSLLILTFVAGCVNPMCLDNGVDKYTFDECIRSEMLIPNRMGIVPPAAIDACSFKAQQVKEKVCAVK